MCFLIEILFWQLMIGGDLSTYYCVHETICNSTKKKYEKKIFDKCAQFDEEQAELLK